MQLDPLRAKQIDFITRHGKAYNVPSELPPDEFKDIASRGIASGQIPEEQIDLILSNIEQFMLTQYRRVHVTWSPRVH